MDCETEDIDPEQVDRSCGFLKKSEREYLLGQKEDISDAYRSTLNNQVQVRTKHALADFRLLADHLEQSEKQKLIDASLPHQKELGPEDTPDDETVEDALRGPLRFFAEVSMGEEKADRLFSQLSQVEEIEDEDSDFVKTRSDMSEKLVKALAQAGYTKQQAQSLIEHYWPDGQR